MKISLSATVVVTLLACANAKWMDNFKSMDPMAQAQTKDIMCPYIAEQYASRIRLCSLNEWTEACLECSPPTDQEDLDCYIDLGCMPAGATVGPRRLRRGRSLGAIMGHQKNHAGRSLSYIIAPYQSSFSRRPYRGPFRGGTSLDYRDWEEYQSTPTKAELRAEKRALKKAIKTCTAHARYIKSTAIAAGPEDSGWWEWKVDYENDPKLKDMKVISGVYTNELPYCIANPRTGDMFTTSQSFMIWERDGPMVKAQNRSPL